MTTPAFSQDANGVAIEVGARCWARYSDGLWYAAYVFKIEGGQYHVYYDADGSDDAVIASRIAVACIIRKTAKSYERLTHPDVQKTLRGLPMSQIIQNRQENCVGFTDELLWALWFYFNHYAFRNVLNPPEIRRAAGSMERNLRNHATSAGYARPLPKDKTTQLMFFPTNLNLHELADTMVHEMVHQWQFQEILFKGRPFNTQEDGHGETFLRWRPTIKAAVGFNLSVTGMTDNNTQIKAPPATNKPGKPVYVAVYYDATSKNYFSAIVKEVTEARRLLTVAAGRHRHALFKLMDRQVRDLNFGGKVGTLRFTMVTRPYVEYVNTHGERQPGYATLPADLNVRR